MSICHEIKLAVICGGIVDIPPDKRPVQIQTWAHTIAQRMGLRVKTWKRVRGRVLFVVIQPEE